MKLGNESEKKLVDHYRFIQSEHPEETFDPPEAIASLASERTLRRNSGADPLCSPETSEIL